MVAYSAIGDILRKFFGSQQEQRVLFLGLDSAGKTTLLYRLALSDVITTIPTIGFNVESVKVSLVNGKTMNITGWDVGGCDKIRPLWRHYFAGTSGAVFMVDSNDRDRWPEAVEEFVRLRAEFVDPRYNGVIPPFLVLANKQDLPTAIPLAEIRSRIMDIKPSQPELIGVFPISATGPPAQFKEDLQRAFEWFDGAMGQSSAKAETTSVNVTEKDTSAASQINSDPRAPEILAQRLENWVQRAQREQSPDEFLEQFTTYSLPAWDHYTHIRIAYLLLQRHGRQKGKNLIFDGIQSYIINSTRSTGRTFHLTMTYFWIQMVHYAMTTMRVSSGDQVIDDFTAFLIFNPHLCDGMLWSDYYTKNVIMTQTAKDTMVLPDKKALPNIIQRDAPRKKI